jgi:hypothetical protein
MRLCGDTSKALPFCKTPSLDDGDEWLARFMVPTPLGGHETDLSVNGADARQAMERLAILIAQDARSQLYG